MTGVSTIAGLAPRRLLVRGVNWLGDAVMTTPALQRLHESLPQTHITLMTPDKLAGLWPNHPAVHDVLTFASSQSPLDVARTLRGRGFDAALILPNSFRSALELWLAGIPNRIGYGGQLRQLLLNYPIPRPLDRAPMRKRARREIIRLIGRGPGNAAGNRRPDATHAGQPKPGAHHIHHYLQLASCLGSSKNPLPPQLFVDPAEVQTISGRFGLDAQPSRPLFGLNPGAEHGPAKRWPVDRFIAVARRVQARADCRWVILGGKGDAELAARVTAGILQGATPGRASDIAINLAGATSLRELCAVLKPAASSSPTTPARCTLPPRLGRRWWSRSAAPLPS